MSTDRLRQEIKQTRPFGSLEEELFLNLQRTASVLSLASAQVLKPHGLSPSQYNVLRILRGAGEAGLPCREVGMRMIAQDPDVTRLLDRMEKCGLVQRSRDREDRRVVKVRISEKGLALVGELDPAVARFHAERMSHMSARDLHTLIGLLEIARSGAPPESAST